MPKGRRQPLEVRVWQFITRSGPDDCWLWNGSRDRRGYGRTGYYVEGRMIPIKAHRAVLEMAHGPIPDGFDVCHRCDNPPCCNPAHLFVGTRSDNMKDMAAKGRHYNQQKTHCPHGHEYTPENTGIQRTRGRSEHRFCLECSRRHKLEHVARRKARLLAETAEQRRAA